MYYDNASGAGISSSALVELHNCTVVNNVARASEEAEGGGIDSGQGTFVATDTTVSGNEAVASWAAGGGVDCAQCTLVSSTISGNRAHSTYWDGGGGGVSGSTVTITSSTISGNEMSGAGFYGNFGGGVVAIAATITSSTITGNTTSNGYGGGVYTRDTLELSSSIVAFNSAYIGPEVRVDSSIPTASYNLIGDPSGSEIPIGVDGNISGDPLLGVLDDNGGPTWTHALDPASPAVDAGANPLGLLADQRGFLPREVNGRADIGAFEFGALPPTIFEDGFESGDTSAWPRP
jgi:hypothetical protein